MCIRFGRLISRFVIGILLFGGYAVLTRGQQRREARGRHVSTGQRITPDAAPGPRFSGRTRTCAPTITRMAATPSAPRLARMVKRC
jgi:hypothetical protein